MKQISKYLILPVLMGMICFITSEDLVMTMVVFIAFLSYALFVMKRHLNRCTHHERRLEECQQFMNGFIIAQSVKNSPSGALESIQGQLSATLKREITLADTIDTYAVLEYLKGYFPYKLYELFLSIIALHTEQGGSIIEMSHLLLETSRRIQTDQREKRMIRMRKLTNFIVLWGMTILVLLFARFGVTSLFDSMLGDLLFKLGLTSYFMFILIAMHAWLMRAFEINDV